MSFTQQHEIIDRVLFHQVKPNCVLSKNVEEALKKTDRALFLPAAYGDVAYGDAPIVLKHRSEIPFYLIAQMIERLSVCSNDNACIVSAGSGYSATLFSHICRHVEAYEGTSVLFARLVDATRHMPNIMAVSTMKKDTVDVIMIDGGAITKIPDNIVQKLRIGGRIVYAKIANPGIQTKQDPLCQLVVQRKIDTLLFDEPVLIAEMHLPPLNLYLDANEPFHF